MDSDKYYTPLEIAAQLARAIDLESVSGIVDSNCGAGHLLSAAAELFPKADCLGIDQDEKTLSRLASAKPFWKLVVGDALDSRSWQIFPEFSGDVAILNPPFSLNHTKGTIVEVEERKIRVSTAMAHVMATILHSRPQKLVAVLPESWAFSEMDNEARRAIQKNYKIEIIGNLKNSVFKGARANAVLVSMAQHTSARRATTSQTIKELPEWISLIRGGLPVFEAKKIKGGIPFLHSTGIEQLISHKKLPSTSVASLNRGLVSGNTLLLPRVGLPKKNLLQPVYLRSTIQLSDCVISIRTKTKEQCLKVAGTIHSRWPDFIECYSGTGARYTTNSRLHRWLSSNIQ